TRGQDQDRAALSRLAQLLDEVHARKFRQAEVDDGDVERHFAAEIEPFLAVPGRIDRESVTLEACRERLAQRSLVFHQQYAHRRLLSCLRVSSWPRRSRLAAAGRGNVL